MQVSLKLFDLLPLGCLCSVTLLAEMEKASSTKPRHWLGKTSMKWPILCRVDVILNSINESKMELENLSIVKPLQYWQHVYTLFLLKEKLRRRTNKGREGEGWEREDKGQGREGKRGRRGKENGRRSKGKGR